MRVQIPGGPSAYTNVTDRKMSGHTAIWTGSEMIVWGGEDDNSQFLNTGGKSNPRTDLGQLLLRIVLPLRVTLTVQYGLAAK